jgi:tetratricopeptide (TPR) repeat protein
MVASIFLAGLLFLSGKAKISIKAANEDLKQKELIKEEERKQSIANLTERGEYLLSVGDYESAKTVFNKAYIIDNKNETSLLGTVKVYLLDCVQNDKECGLCEYYVKIAEQTLDAKTRETYLGELLERYEQKKLFEEQKLNDEILRLLNNAYKALDGYSLKTAEHFVYKAYHLNPDKYETNIAVLRIYIEYCLRNGDCYRVERKFNSLMRKYGETKELRDMKLLMQTKN